MHLYNRIKKRLTKKGGIPGWNVIIGLIIGLFVILALVYISFKSKDFLLDKIEFLRNIF